MAFQVFPIGDVSLNTIQGVSDYWVRLPAGSKPIRNITTQLWGSLALCLAGGCKGVLMESLRVADSVVIDNCEDAWDEVVGANVTATLDAVDFVVGAGSCQFDFVVATAAGALTTEIVAPGDLDIYTHIEYWIKSTKATAAGDLTLNLDDTAKCASPLETLAVPALTANVWTHVRTALANPQLDIAIISVGLAYAVDTADIYSVNIDDIRAVTLARSVEVLKVDLFQEDDMYFALSAGIENDGGKTNRVLYVYYESPEEDSRCSN